MQLPFTHTNSSTLLFPDTEKIYRHGISTVMKKYGCEYVDEVRAKLLGTTPPDMMTILFQETNLAESGKTKEEIYKEMVDTYEPLMSSPEWMPGLGTFLGTLCRYMYVCLCPYFL